VRSAVLKVAYLALFPLTLLMGLFRLPKIWLNWFISWGTFSITAVWCLLLIPQLSAMKATVGWAVQFKVRLLRAGPKICLPPGGEAHGIPM